MNVVTANSGKIYNISIASEHVKPIPVSEFSSHVERLHADRDKLFEMEYEVCVCICVCMHSRVCVCVCVCVHIILFSEVFRTILLFIFVRHSCVMS